MNTRKEHLPLIMIRISSDFHTTALRPMAATQSGLNTKASENKACNVPSEDGGDRLARQEQHHGTSWSAGWVWSER